MLKIGQKVKIREDLMDVASIGLWSDMLRLAGAEAEIESGKLTEIGMVYTIVGSPRSWSEDCFEVPYECIRCGLSNDLVVSNKIYLCTDCIEEMHVHIERMEER
jgi:hypothetical protein